MTKTYGTLALLGGVALVAATIAMGLIAGVYYAYACSVMPGLRRTDDRTFVNTMQSVNAAILNRWFFASFFGALLLTVLAGALHLGPGARSVLPWIAAAFALYAVTLVVTVGVNVPLNDALAAAGDPDVADLTSVRARFESAWVRANLVRALASTAAFACLTWALVLHGRAQ